MAQVLLGGLISPDTLIFGGFVVLGVLSVVNLRHKVVKTDISRKIEEPDAHKNKDLDEICQHIIENN